MRGGARKGTGGAQLGAGRPRDKEPTKPYGVRLTAAQHEAFIELGSSAWIQGLCNLHIRSKNKETKGK